MEQREISVMTEDIERLFRNINQADIPYQVFEAPTVPSPAIGHAEPETTSAELATWAAEPAALPPSETVRGKVFGKYTPAARAEAVVDAAVGTPLKPIFDRLREKCRTAKG